MSLKLRPIENLTQVDKIELSLQEFFQREKLLPGDAIPKEQELARALGVSRTAIREALSRFRTIGIIESRKNRGMIIVRPDILNNMQRVLDTQLLDGETMKEIFELRLIIELGLSDILFLRKTTSDLQQLELLVNQEDTTSDKMEKLKLDVEFHSMLYKISGNKTIIRFQDLLYPIFEYVNKVIQAGRIVHENAVSHRDLLNVLKNGNADEFRMQMREHLKHFLMAS